MDNRNFDHFGSMGSVFTNLAKPVYPPKGLVITAIQFLNDNTPTRLITETLDGSGPQFPTTEDDELRSDGGPDNNYLGATEAAANGAGSSVGVVTLTGANADIKVGQYIIIGADGDTIDAGITLDGAAGNITPIYRGPNAQGLVVAAIDGTSLTIQNADGSVFDASSIDASNTFYFLDEFHGVGGTTTEGVKFPKGLTIYGRWTTLVPEADATGGVICYFGR